VAQTRKGPLVSGSPSRQGLEGRDVGIRAIPERIGGRAGRRYQSIAAGKSGSAVGVARRRAPTNVFAAQSGRISQARFAPASARNRSQGLWRKTAGTYSSTQAALAGLVKSRYAVLTVDVCPPCQARAAIKKTGIAGLSDLYGAILILTAEGEVLCSGSQPPATSPTKDGYERPRHEVGLQSSRGTRR